MYVCAGQSRVRESVRYITHNSYAISVVPPFNNLNLIVLMQIIDIVIKDIDVL